MKTFNIYFGMFVIFIALLLLVKNKLKPIKLKRERSILRTYTDQNGITYEYVFRAITGIAIAFVVGFTSGLFGIGGGAFMVPAMILIFQFPPHVAVATSMFMIFLLSLVGSATHISLGNMNWLYAFALITGAWFGAKLGAYTNSKLKSDTVGIDL